MTTTVSFGAKLRYGRRRGSQGIASIPHLADYVSVGVLPSDMERTAIGPRSGLPTPLHEFAEIELVKLHTLLDISQVN